MNAKKALTGIILYTYKSKTREKTGRTGGYGWAPNRSI
jgi:hypothetical protein